MENKIRKIVLTGGPCAGKTEVLGQLERYLVEKGYYVITLPETARELIESKILPAFDGENILTFQDIILKMQCTKEDSAVRYANKVLNGKDVIILCDRGIMDNRAYLNAQEEFDYLLEKNGLNEQQIVHGYDLVIDLISTATCKKDLYQLDSARKESVELAAELDKKTTLAWIDHPRLVTIKPTDKIEDKVGRVKEVVDDFLNGVEYNNTTRQRVDGSLVLDNFDSENSKVVDVYKSYVKGDLVVTHKKCRDHSIMVLGKFNQSFDDKVISGDEFINLINEKPIVFTENSRETMFTENGNVYKIIEADDKSYLSYDKSCSPSEVRDILSKISKRFVKRND